MEKTERAQQFDSLMAQPDGQMPRALADAMRDEYPYFMPAVVMTLKRADKSAAGLDDALAWAATSFGSRADLYNLVGDRAADFRDFYPKEDGGKAGKSTMDTIEHFLDTFGNSGDEEVKALEQRIFNPVPDYAQLLAKEEEKSVPADGETADGEPLSENDLLINKFIRRSKQQSGHFPTDGEPREEALPAEVAEAPAPVAADAADPSMLSESLAKIYIRQRRYDKALEIIQSLSLNFPEKSIYFADQIRFLKKLIMNEEYKQKNDR